MNAVTVHLKEKIRRKIMRAGLGCAPEMPPALVRELALARYSDQSGYDSPEQKLFTLLVDAAVAYVTELGHAGMTTGSAIDATLTGLAENLDVIMPDKEATS